MIEGCFSGIFIKPRAEAILAKFTGADYACLTGTGFSGLQASLIALSVKTGEQVVMPNVTCPSVYYAIRSLGAIPLIVDVADDLPLISHKVLKKYYKKSRVAIVPQMFGMKQDLEPFSNLGFSVIDDSAQSFSPRLDQSAAITVFSFSPTKLITIGYGGAVVTNHAPMIDRVKAFLDIEHLSYACEEYPDFVFRINSSISDFQSAMLIEQLNRYHHIINCRNELVNAYDNLLLPLKRLDFEVPFRYQLILPGANSQELANALRNHSIGAHSLGSQLIHKTLRINGAYKNSERWYDTVLSLPLHEGLSLSDIEYISSLVMRYI
jgi:dTDP-4-amino-4,6-dideoxygalactose transaminase